MNIVNALIRSPFATFPYFAIALNGFSEVATRKGMRLINSDPYIKITDLLSKFFADKHVPPSPVDNSNNISISDEDRELQLALELSQKEF